MGRPLPPACPYLSTVGAAVALLTFIGGLPHADQKRAVAATLDWFAWGIAAALAGLALAYFTNYCMTMSERSKIWTDQPPYVIDGPTTNRFNILNRVFHFLSFIAGVSCLVLFIPCSLPNHLAPRPSGVFLVPKAF